jgi:hypothetical protein
MSDRDDKDTQEPNFNVLHNSGMLGKSYRWTEWMCIHQEVGADPELWCWAG